MTQTVFVVDDDAAIRDALAQLLETASLPVESHADGRSFLDAYVEDRPGCLLLDMAMPGMTGLEVQAALRERGLRPGPDLRDEMERLWEAAKDQSSGSR